MRVAASLVAEGRNLGGQFLDRLDAGIAQALLGQKRRLDGDLVRNLLAGDLQSARRGSETAPTTAGLVATVATQGLPSSVISWISAVETSAE